MTRTLLIGIDGASPTWLARWMAEGKLPELARLRDGGCLGPLRSTPNMMSPSAWTSITTGVGPGRHGVFGFFDRLPGSYRFRPSDARARAADPWWVIASRAGLRTAVLNVPCTWPADAVNGLQVAGWLTPSARAPGFTCPPELAGELAVRFGDYPLHSDVQRLVATGRLAATRDRILRSLHRKAEIARHLLARERWDLMAVVFADTDAAQHYLWHLTDPAHPAHGAGARATVGDVVLAAYQEIDRAIPALLDAARPDVVLVVSDHGVGVEHRGHLFLPGVLDALGWQVRKRSRLRGIAQAAGRLLPAGVKHRLAARTGRDIAGSMLVGDVTWARTRAFTIAHGGRTDIALNVRGREPEGALDAEDVADAVAELCGLLADCVDPATGVPVLEDIARRGDVYAGPYVALAPDLLMRWREDLPPLAGLRCGDITVTHAEGDQLHTGGHRGDGVLLAAGDGVNRGGTVAGARVEDIAPTLLHLAGLPVPRYCDGRVVEGIFREAPEVRFDDAATLRGGPGGGDAADPRVTERLRGLGYL